jgi:hypothetical protein
VDFPAPSEQVGLGRSHARMPSSQHTLTAASSARRRGQLFAARRAAPGTRDAQLLALVHTATALRQAFAAEAEVGGRVGG